MRNVMKCFQEVRTEQTSNQLYRFGQTFINGTYIVEVRQGEKRSTLKLIKH